MALLGVLGAATGSAEPAAQKPRAPTLSASQAAPPKSAFKVFDATLYSQKPDLGKHGVLPLVIAYEPRIFTESSRSKRPPDAMPDDDLLRAQAEAARAANSEYLVIDIESWSVNDSTRYPREAAQSIARFTQVIKQARRVAPQIKLGLFGALPVHSGYSRMVAPKGSAADLEMLHDNDNLLPLAAVVDGLFPIGYTFTDDRQEWSIVLAKQVSEARRLNPHVPLYVFLWARYTDYGGTPERLKLRWIESDYWLYQLQTAYGLADGIVIWGGWDAERNRPQAWDAQAPWWQETLSFLADKKLSPAGVGQKP